MHTMDRAPGQDIGIGPISPCASEVNPQMAFCVIDCDCVDSLDISGYF